MAVCSLTPALEWVLNGGFGIASLVCWALISIAYQFGKNISRPPGKLIAASAFMNIIGATYFSLLPSTKE
jgi:hypothetical protein